MAANKMQTQFKLFQSMSGSVFVDLFLPSSSLGSKAYRGFNAVQKQREKNTFKKDVQKGLIKVTSIFLSMWNFSAKSKINLNCLWAIVLSIYILYFFALILLTDPV